MCFPGKRRLGKPLALDIGGTRIESGPTMKYLEVMLDSKLLFKKHLDYTDQKVQKVIRALGRLMPNLRGPREESRRLYANTVLFVALYAAPIWADAVTASRRRREKLDGIMRYTNLRVISAYRTVFFTGSRLFVSKDSSLAFASEDENEDVSKARRFKKEGSMVDQRGKQHTE